MFCRWLLLSFASVLSIAKADEPEWTHHSARSEIAPIFEAQEATWLIRADHRSGLSGYWSRRFDVQPETTYRFSVLRRTHGISHPRRSAIARIVWLDDQSRHVTHRDATELSYRPGERPRAEPEFPPVVGTEGDWEKLQGEYQSPPNATRAVVELHFRWGDPHSSVRWSKAELTRVTASKPRKVRLASIHYRPEKGKSPIEKCELFAPLIEEAAQGNADLIVLPETLTFYHSGGTYADAAESIPGPSTRYFGRLAKRHELYIVAGLMEREGRLIYNVAVLIGPDGDVVGKYRKVCLPRGEIEAGITPGTDYPVFETRFGKVGMMVCYDGFFPEVARELTNRGAEVIAWPVWGCNPLLAAARACENHVYLVSSTYTDHSLDWMVSAIYDHAGRTLDVAEEWGSIAIAEVDLNKTSHWHSLGDYRAQLPAHRPVVPSE